MNVMTRGLFHCHGELYLLATAMSVSAGKIAPTAMRPKWRPSKALSLLGDIFATSYRVA